MRNRACTRREVVRRGGAALATGGLAAVAGCAGRGGTGTGGTATRAGDPTPTDTATATSERWTGPEYGRWLPAPGTAIPVAQYPFGMTDLTQYADHVGELPGGLRGVVQSWHPVEIDWRTVPLSLSLHGNNVIRADYDRGAIVDGVAGTEGWTEMEGYEGYALLQAGDDSKAIAVGDAAIVVAHGYGEARTAADVARGIVDTARGRGTTYAAESDAVDAVMDEFDDGGFVNTWRPVEAFDASPRDEPEFDGQAGIGQWGRFVDGTTSAVKLVVVFESADAVDVDRVRSYVDEHGDDGEPFAPWEDLEVHRNGRLVVIEGTVSRRRR